MSTDVKDVLKVIESVPAFARLEYGTDGMKIIPTLRVVREAAKKFDTSDKISVIESMVMQMPELSIKGYSPFAKRFADTIAEIIQDTKQPEEKDRLNQTLINAISDATPSLIRKGINPVQNTISLSDQFILVGGSGAILLSKSKEVLYVYTGKDLQEIGGIARVDDLHRKDDYDGEEKDQVANLMKVGRVFTDVAFGRMSAKEAAPIISAMMNQPVYVASAP